MQYVIVNLKLKCYTGYNCSSIGLRGSTRKSEPSRLNNEGEGVRLRRSRFIYKKSYYMNGILSEMYHRQQRWCEDVEIEEALASCTAGWVSVCKTNAHSEACLSIAVNWLDQRE